MPMSGSYRLISQAGWSSCDSLSFPLSISVAAAVASGFAVCRFLILATLSDRLHVCGQCPCVGATIQSARLAGIDVTLPIYLSLVLLSLLAAGQGLKGIALGIASVTEAVSLMMHSLVSMILGVVCESFCFSDVPKDVLAAPVWVKTYNALSVPHAHTQNIRYQTQGVVLSLSGSSWWCLRLAYTCTYTRHLTLKAAGGSSRGASLNSGVGSIT